MGPTTNSSNINNYRRAQGPSSPSIPSSTTAAPVTASQLSATEAYAGPSASIDDSPPASLSSSSDISPTSSVTDILDQDRVVAAYRTSPQPNNSNPTTIMSEPLPEIQPMMRSISSPTLKTESNSHAPRLLAARQYSQDRVTPSEIRSTPIYTPVFHHPAPTRRTHSSALHSQPHPPRSPSRTPSPNSHMHTQGSRSQPPLTSQSPHQRSQQQQPHNRLPNASNSPLRCQLTASPGALKPDSVVSFPDSSPVMAPHVLAAVDARLRESSRKHAIATQSSSSSLHLPQSQRPALFTAHSHSSVASKASSFTPVITHHEVMESSKAIVSREQLFDVLNGDEDDGDGGCTLENGSQNHSLRKPQPGFASSGRQSARSSRRNSNSSSLASGSVIELTASGPRLHSPTPSPRGPTPLSKAYDGSGRGSRNNRELASAAMTSHDYNDSHSVMGSNALFPEKSDWLKRKSRTSRKWRGICCAIGILAFIAAATGIVLGFVLRKGKVDGLASPVDQDKSSNKPLPPITHFTPDPKLRKAFYGLDYNPAKSLMPWCGVTLQNVVDDVILISQLTNRIRLYGMDCEQADLTFQAINALNLNNTMKVVLTVWIDKDPATNQRQYETLFKVLDTYGTDMVQGVSVGNEVLFRGDMVLTDLSEIMKNVRATLKNRYNKVIPVFTSDIGNKLDASVAAVSDELFGNLHPYFSGTAVSEAANWTISQYNDIILGNPTNTGLKGAISEVGWPSAPASAVYQTYAVPGLANLQTMIDTFICQANAAGIPYYWFEFKDEPWKNDPSVPVEPYWGIFDKDGNLKIKIPNCIAP